MSAQQLLDRVLTLVCNTFDSYSAVLFLPGPESEGVRLVAGFSLGQLAPVGTSLVPGQGLAGFILREQKPLLVSNVDQRRSGTGYYPKGQGTDIKAFLGVPLPDIPGVLCVDSKKAYGFTEKDQKILSEFAQLAAELHKAFSGLDACRDELRISPCLRQLTLLPRLHPKWKTYLAKLLELCVEATGFETAFLAVLGAGSRSFLVEGAAGPLLSQGQGKGNTYPVSGGMIGWVLKHGSQALSSDSTSGARLFGAQVNSPAFESVICQPVSFSRRTRAVLVLASQNPQPQGETVKDFARTVADQLALFLENLHLKARLSNRA
ncbi:GAF domain-containing protein [Fundidesulfovibrio butyratiphilus]